MRILILHNRYQVSSGEESVLKAEQELLEENGHIVRLLEVSNCDIDGIFSKVATAVNAIYSPSSKQQVQAVISQFQPAIVHVHNFFPLLSPSIYFACNEAGVPVVQTLHNYRLLCAIASFYRDGQICEACLGKPFGWPGVIRKCYRGSSVGSAAVSAMASIHRWLDTWSKRIDGYICLSEFAREKFIQGKLPAEKIFVKPNFVYPWSQTLETTQLALGCKPYALYVGRLWQEKGINTLLEAWKLLKPEFQLKIVGDGPLLQEVESVGQQLESIELLGKQPSESVYELMAKAQFLIVPSEWYEPFGLTVIEALSVGTPVVASKIGALSEIVVDGLTGLHFESGNPTDLAEKIQWAIAHPEAVKKMGEAAYSSYQATYTPEVNYRQLIYIYESVIDRVKPYR